MLRSSSKRLFLFLSLIFIISACAPNNKAVLNEVITPSLTVTEQVESKSDSSNDTINQVQPMLFFTEYDCLAQENGKYAKYNKVLVEGINYHVDREEYLDEECLEIIYYLDSIISRLKDEYSFSTPEDLSIYISSKIITQGTYANICINSHDINTIDGLIAMISGFYGELSNYGLCYGLALHMNNVEKQGADIADYFSNDENIILLDFSYAIFETDYFDKEDNLHASSAAYLFTKYIIEEHGISTLSSLIEQSTELTLDFDISYTKICNEWLQSIGAMCRRVTPEVAIRCIKNLGRTSTEYKYVFHTKSMLSFIPIGFIEYNMGIELTYTEIIKMLTLGELDLNVVKEHVSPYFETDLKQISCYYKVEGTNFNWFRDSYIEYISPYYAFVHEYAHYITLNNHNIYPVWLREGIAVYMTAYFPNKLYSQNMKIFLKNIIHTHEKSDDIDSKEEDLKLLNDILLLGDSLGTVYNDLYAFRSYRDETTQFNFSELLRNGKSEGWFMTYEEAGSVINYLINLYGADTFFSLYKGEITLDEAYGKDINEIYEEWGEYIIARYGDVLMLVE